MTDKEQELLSKINTLEKEVEKLKKSVKKKKYGLVWMDIPEAFEDDLENKLPILTEVKDKAIINNDNKQTHILIEGDNYHALTCLNYTHKEKIDVIYIDPPYNTGSDGFKYRDKRFIEKFPDGQDVPKDHPFRHSYWLSFMKKRLELAKYLLKDSGCIFISINEEELYQLKLLCDDIFGENNYLTMFTIKLRHEDRILKGDKDFHEVVEYLLMYRKSNQFKTIKRKKDNTSLDEYVYLIKEKISNPEKKVMGNKEVYIFKPNEYEIIKVPPSIDAFKKINIRGSIKEGNSSGRFYIAYLEAIKNNNSFLYKVLGMGADKFGYRYFLAPKNDKKVNGDYFQGVPVDRDDIIDMPYPNFFDFETDFNNVGYEGGIEFRNGKKPINFIKHFINLGTDKNNIKVLDFFAGSGSTGHSVLELNKYENRNIQFILITNNENNIAEERCYPRLKNAINGHIVKSDIKEPLGNSLKYYKTDFVGKNKIKLADDHDAIDLAHKAGYLLAIAENTLFEIENKTNKFFQFFEDNCDKNKKYTAVYFREELDKLHDFVKEVGKFRNKTTVYIFSWGEVSEYAFEFDDFPNVRVKTIPQPILEIYKSIYNLEEEC